MNQRHTDLSLPYLERVPSGRTEQQLPIFVLLHGRGSDSSDLAELAPALDHGYRFICPDAPMPFEIFRGYSQGFTWFHGWPPEQQSFDRSRDLLVTFLGEISERYATPLSRFVIGGFSQGGMMSIDVGYRIDPHPAGIVVMSGATYESQLPDIASGKSIPILVAHGIADDVIPVNAARRTRAILEQHGASPEYYEYEMGHFVIPEEIAVVKEFLQRVLG